MLPKVSNESERFKRSKVWGRKRKENFGHSKHVRWPDLKNMFRLKRKITERHTKLFQSFPTVCGDVDFVEGFLVLKTMTGQSTNFQKGFFVLFFFFLVSYMKKGRFNYSLPFENKISIESARSNILFIVPFAGVGGAG